MKLPVPAGHRWQPGDRLDLLGPIGTGFQPPTRSERWLLWAYRAPLYPLRPLLELGLGSGRALVVASGQVLHGLPPEVEVVRQASTAIAWADYLAICLSPTHLAEVLSALDPPDRLAPLPTGQALLYSQLPCGFGGCGACGLPTGDGWRSACTDGPVFPLEELLGG